MFIIMVKKKCSVKVWERLWSKETSVESWYKKLIKRVLQCQIPTFYWLSHPSLCRLLGSTALCYCFVLCTRVPADKSQFVTTLCYLSINLCHYWIFFFKGLTVLYFLGRTVSPVCIPGLKICNVFTQSEISMICLKGNKSPWNTWA